MSLSRMLEGVAAVAVLVAIFVILHSRNSTNKKKVGVIVLGDVGRSPRMRQHCLSLAREGFTVSYIAEKGKVPHPDLVSNENISLHLISPYSLPLPRTINLLVKPVIQSVFLFVKCSRFFWGCGSVLMQNPPTIPVMAVVWIICKIYNAKMVIDWHNYGYTILGLNLEPSSYLLKVAKIFERTFGRLADDNFCVTNAMSSDLHKNWGIKAFTLHDRPSAITTLTLQQKHELLNRLKVEYPVFGSRVDLASSNTLLTQGGEGGKVAELEKRAALIVSSTSWTPDEDFSILLSALVSYNEGWTPDHPDIVCAITGSGPLKQHFEEKIAALCLEHVQIVTCWLEPEDYPRLLAAADLGVSLHFSSSGLDLPMKVVDMFAAGIPVCARNFECLNELVLHGKNGCVFDDSDQLSRQLITIFTKFGQKENKHFQILRNGVEHFRKLPWHYHWKHIALPSFDDQFVFEDFGPDNLDEALNQFLGRGGDPSQMAGMAQE